MAGSSERQVLEVIESRAGSAGAQLAGADDSSQRVPGLGVDQMWRPDAPPVGEQGAPRLLRELSTGQVGNQQRGIDDRQPHASRTSRSAEMTVAARTADRPRAATRASISPSVGCDVAASSSCLT